MINLHWCLLSFALASLLIGGFSRYGQTEGIWYGQTDTWVTQAVIVPQLEQHIFFSPRARTQVSYHVYIPEAYHSDETRSFPVIYWLHGYRGGVKYLPQVVEYFDSAMRSGKMPPALVVFPNGLAESMWCDSKDGRIPMESVVIEELIPQVDSTFRTIPVRPGRILEGFSMGGYGAARLGFKYADKFGAVSILGAGPMQRQLDVEDGPTGMAEARLRAMRLVYGDDQSYFNAQSPWALAQKYANNLRNKNLMIRILVGEHDDMLPPNREFSSYLSRLGIHHDFLVLPKVGHNPLALLKAYGDTNWLFYQKAFSARLVGLR